jgi:hypothetical protein
LLLCSSHLLLGFPTGRSSTSTPHHQRTNLGHRAVTTVLDTRVAVDDLGHHRQDTTKAQGTEEPKDPALPPRHTITKTTKNRWEHRTLLAEFAPHLYLKGSNYPMISRITMDLRSHSHGSQIICKQSKY